MTARVDDLRVRQDQVDHADVQEVVRHLVDEERAIGLAVDARLCDEPLAELAQPRGIQRGEHVGVGADRLRVRLAAQLARHRHDLGQFHRAFDRGVAGEDLFEQGRARARQADDEDRVR